MNPVIETRSLTKRYRRVTALSEATITVPEGAISALIGPNGAGKTTLLRLLTGLARPTGGEVAVLGGIPRQDPAFLADIGFLAQEIPLYRRLSAADHIATAAHPNPPRGAASAPRRLRAPEGPRGDREGAHPGAGRADCPPDHPAAADERPGDRPGLRGRRRHPRGTGARLHGPERPGRLRTPEHSWRRAMTWLTWRQYR